MSVREIARLAGISHAAVSLALRGSPKVSEPTRRRVRELAIRTGYRPNVKLREMMTQLSLSRRKDARGCLGVVSLYATARPWEQSVHLKRMLEGMTARAEFLGYRLEPFGITAPGMSHGRLRSILEARGVEGLLCLGAEEFGTPFPPELNAHAVVTQGLSISTPLHRVVNDAYDDTWEALDRAHELGYRRPGLILGHYEEVRGGHANAGAYLGWCEHQMGIKAAIPILRLDRIEDERLSLWLRRNDPDIAIFVHHYSAVPELRAALRRLGVPVPGRLAVIVLSQVVRGSGFAGMEENPGLMGERAVELLLARILNRDFGIPAEPRVETVKSRWVDGASLVRRREPPGLSASLRLRGRWLRPASRLPST